MTHNELFTTDNDDGLYGVYTAIVADIKDPENMGRVKVRFPWRDAKDKSTWARVATPMAGKKMGAYFLPEKKDEVLVAFDDGDIHEPYVIGSLWNGKQKPPEKNTKKNKVRKIKTRSGHELVFTDDKKTGSVEITTAAGQKIRIDDKKKEVTVKDKNKNTIKTSSSGISITSNKDITLDGKNITLNAKQNVKIAGTNLKANAKAKAQLAAKGQLALSSKGKANLKASGMLNVKSSGLLKMKGSMIMLN